MKKVLSLLLVCTMILSFAAMTVVNAAGEGYTITAGTIDNVKSGKNYVPTYVDTTTFEATSAYDESFENVLFTSENVALKVVTNTAASGGYIVIDYDETKVTPVTLAADGTEVYRDTDTDYGWAVAEGNATITETAMATDVADGNLIVTWTGAMSAGDTVCYITFLCNENVKTTAFDSTTFAISEDADFLASKNRFNGGASLDYQGTTYKVSDSTLSTSVKYPNSEPTEEKTIDEVATALPTDNTDNKYGESYDAAAAIKFPTKTGGAADGDAANIKKSAVVFGKAVKALGAETYGIKVGKFFYPGVADVAAGQYWSIILVTTDDTALTSSYTYNVLYDTDKEGTKEGTKTLYDEAQTLVVK